MADSYEMSKWFGDDMATRADSYLVDMTGLPMMRLCNPGVPDPRGCNIALHQRNHVRNRQVMCLHDPGLHGCIRDRPHGG